MTGTLDYRRITVPFAGFGVKPSKLQIDSNRKFRLESERVKKVLEDFLRRDLTQLTKRKPEFAHHLSGRDE